MEATLLWESPIQIQRRGSWMAAQTIREWRHREFVQYFAFQWDLPDANFTFTIDRVPLAVLKANTTEQLGIDRPIQRKVAINYAEMRKILDCSAEDIYDVHDKQFSLPESSSAFTEMKSTLYDSTEPFESLKSVLFSVIAHSMIATDAPDLKLCDFSMVNSGDVGTLDFMPNISPVSSKSLSIIDVHVTPRSQSRQEALILRRQPQTNFSPIKRNIDYDMNNSDRLSACYADLEPDRFNLQEERIDRSDLLTEKFCKVQFFNGESSAGPCHRIPSSHSISSMPCDEVSTVGYNNQFLPTCSNEVIKLTTCLVEPVAIRADETINNVVVGDNFTVLGLRRYLKSRNSERSKYSRRDGSKVSRAIRGFFKPVTAGFTSSFESDSSENLNLFEKLFMSVRNKEQSKG
ncbi:hypothetical protein V1512DRAFT_257417 [Lipomyces arxii]|uniref:uncharacterized protein n=1 Tax=Lipomyces arxii TaxID=56418 RepID=UPI0034CE2783